MTICQITKVCTIEDHANVLCDCADAEWVHEYEDKDLGLSACRCIECIDEIELNPTLRTIPSGATFRR